VEGGRRKVQSGAIRCNWLQVFHTKETKGTKWKQAQFAATGCKWLQTSATWFDPV
jgi:hypothetical protein